ncbi:M48 family metallopeptidase [Candidatus Saccharibacteria bacterium]|nr:M48 family metallopeptidase [Candidatus Saccharibacteria bacterium]MBR0372589.1 M48 family metallopeptidase [Candidatus Saccharibacteria bacterium]
MIIEDKEFGEVIVRKSPLSKNIKFSISTSGRLQMSVPTYTSDFLAKRFLNTNRKMIREKLPVKDPSEQRARDYQKKILMKKAREYLPYRLEYFAKLYGYSYSRCRLTHANTRWGSCSSNRTISLNIGLMKLPEPLRDYVIIHELAHLNHMDHSKSFWAEVHKHDKNYRIHEKKLKLFNPGV